MVVSKKGKQLCQLHIRVGRFKAKQKFEYVDAGKQTFEDGYD